MGLEPLPLYTVGGKAEAATPVLYANSGAAAVLAAAAAAAADNGGRAEDEMEGLSEERLDPTAAEAGLAMPLCNPCFQ